MNTLKLFTMALAMSAAIIPGIARADMAADIKQPRWYTAPSAKTMEIAKRDNIDGVVVSDGQRGEPGFPAANLKLTPEQIAKVRLATSPSPFQWVGWVTTGPANN